MTFPRTANVFYSPRTRPTDTRILALLDVATKKITWLTHDKWEIRGGEFSPDGKHLTFSANVDGNEDIYLHDLVTGKSMALPIPKGVNEPCGRTFRFHQRWHAPALQP